MRANRVFALTLLVALSSCDKSANYPSATYAEIDGHYAVTLFGRRMLMAHDPISALQFKTYETTITLVLPRLSGHINGSEMPVKLGYYSYGGSIDISGNNMEVRLFADNYDDHKHDDVSWNGKYTLVKQ